MRRFAAPYEDAGVEDRKKVQTAATGSRPGPKALHSGLRRNMISTNNS